MNAIEVTGDQKQAKTKSITQRRELTQCTRWIGYTGGSHEKRGAHGVGRAGSEPHVPTRAFLDRLDVASAGLLAAFSSASTSISVSSGTTTVGASLALRGIVEQCGYPTKDTTCPRLSLQRARSGP